MPWFGVLRLWMCLLGLFVASWMVSSAEAQSCDPPVRTCHASIDCGAAPCGPSEDCRGRVQCVDGTCQQSCDNAGDADATACTLGQACAPGFANGREHHACRPVTFAMDLNLLDTCIYHVIEGIPPAQGENACSLESRLARMMGDGVFPFDIFDLDTCITRFLNEEPCNRNTQSCGTGADGVSRGVFCTTATEQEICGKGSHCNTNLNRCERQCGFVPGPDESIERPCAGNLEVCDYERGRCKAVKLGDNEPCKLDADCRNGGQCSGGTCQTTCNIDLDCPSGAYCLLGQCRPRCFRNLDCADSTWYCGATNRCEPLPVSNPGGGVLARPEDHTVRFAVDSVALDTFMDESDVPLMIMNHLTGKPVFDHPELVFGYRLEAKYAVKQSPECRGNLALLSQQAREECLIDPSEQFLLMEEPFGRIYGDGDALLPVRIDHDRAARLGTGNYAVTLSAFFSNGNSASVQIHFRKPSQNGDYSGRVSLFTGGPARFGVDGDITNHLGTTKISAHLYVAPAEPAANIVQWDELLRANHLEGDREFIDVTRGQKITGYLDGNGTFLFAKPTASTRAANRIPVVGIYSPQLGRMRLIGVVEVPADYCMAADGGCSLPDATSTANRPLTVRNPFKRQVRRVFQFIGPYDARTSRFSGLYRETISGLGAEDISVEGGFSLEQVQQDDTVITQGPLLASSSTVTFPAQEAIVAQLDDVIDDTCPAVVNGTTTPRVSDWFASETTFQCYQSAAAGQPFGSWTQSCREAFTTMPTGRVLPSAVRLFGAMASAMNNIGAAGKRVFTEALDSQLTFCDGDAVAAATRNCIDRTSVDCGLALYRKAVVLGWISPSAAIDEQRGLMGQTAAASGSTPNPRDGAVLFCSARPGTDGNVTCPAQVASSPNLFALQELGSFYREAIGRRAFAGANKLSEAFFLMYKLVGAGAMRQGETFELKRRALREAVGSYDQAVLAMFSPAATSVLKGWPALAFQRTSREWIEQMRTTLFDRIDAIAELSDLERRLLDQATEERFVVAHHALSMDYLAHVLLGQTQADWERENFRYVGDAPRLFQLGEGILAKMDESKNPLGLHPNRVYFDNPDANVSNWQGLRERLRRQVQPGGGATTLAAAVAAAVTSMEQATRSEQEFQESLQEARRTLQMELDQLCGPENENNIPTQCVDPAENALAESCDGEGCLFQYQCDGDECDQITKVFESASSNLACRTDQPTYTVKGEDGTQRNCMRGELGGLLQERVLLDLQRKQAMRDIQLLLRQVSRQQAFIAEIRSTNTEIINEIHTQAEKLRDTERDLRGAQFMYDTVLNGAEILKCITIGGAASGGNCAKVAGWVLAAQAGLEARHRIDEALLDAKSRAEEAAKVRFAELEHDATMKELMLDLDSTVTSVYSHISEFETVMQQLFNIDVRIADTHYLAERAAERYAENLDWQAQRMERLSGWKSSDVLRRNAEVSAANTALRGALITSYELVQAMRYDLNATEDAILSARDGQNNPLSFNGVYKLSTLQDFDWFLSSIDDLNEKRCVVLQRSGQGDCQSEADERQYSVSLQKLLFPDLHDIIDSSTGRVLTEGHQFHQRITSPEFLRKRPRGNGFVWQIELPFGIWPQELARLKAEASDQDNISSGQCNLRIRQNGISMKAVGSLLAPNLTVKLFRGGTDYQRSCYEPGGTDDAIKSYKVSWVPGADAERDAEPFQSFVIFQGVTSPGAPVFLNRFQDRSLAAPDYVLVIELTENQPPTDHWLFKATAGGQMPVLEDLRLTFKYRAVDFQ